ncbi:hypothetical protein C0J52_20043 [Blattella germanica]|nr:hypothetical protein C0J52_20043 [Blattella germanica]
MWKILLAIAIVGIVWSNALPKDSASKMHMIRKRQSTHRYCGPHLVSALRLLCNGRYYTPDEDEDDTTTEKRSTTTNELEAKRKYSEESEKPQFPFRSREEANSLKPKFFRRKRRMIVEECCNLKGCSVNELMEYCAD